MQRRTLSLMVIFSLILLVFSVLFYAGEEVNAAKKSRRGWLGVYIQELTPSLREALKLGDRKGLVITEVVEDSPADEAGLREEDVILEFDGKKVEKVREFTRLVRRTPPGTRVKLLIFRDGKEKEIEVEIGKSRKRDVDVLVLGDKGLRIHFGYPRLGVRVHDLNADLADYFHVKEYEGVLILDVQEDSPAEDADLKPGDVITKIDDEKINDVEDLKETLEDYDEGDVVTVEIVRKGKRQTVEVELEGYGYGYRDWFPRRFRFHRFFNRDFDEATIHLSPFLLPELPKVLPPTLFPDKDKQGKVKVHQI